MATLCAEHVKSTTNFKPYVYTFGMPRVGFQSFADMYSSNVGPERIFRVHHRADIVLCIPFWPFVHVPTFHGNAYNYLMPSPGDFPGAKWHDMSLYVNSVSEKSWDTLRSLENSRSNKKQVEQWIKSKKPISMTISNINWINKALDFRVTRCANVVGKTHTIGFGAGFTLMDRLAYILKKGIDISKDLSNLVLYFIRKVMHFLGLSKALDVVDLTR